MVSEYFIGVDVGTGSVKAVAVSVDGTVLSNAQVHYHHTEGYGPFEHDPEHIYSAFVQVLRKLVKEIHGRPVTVSLSTAMHSLILVGKNNASLTPMITWADDRAHEIADRARKSSIGEMLYEGTGTPVHAMSPLFKIIWFRENAPDLFHAAQKFISIKEYIWFKLFGEYEVDFSIASASGLMNISRCRWDTNALELAEISSEKLSSLVGIYHARNKMHATASRDLEFDPDTRFLIGSSDGCMANLGSLATSSGTAALTIGTSGALRIASKNPIYNFDAMTFNYRLDEQTFICGGPTNNGGIVLKWYVEQLLGRSLENIKDYDDILTKVRTVTPGSNGLIFLPYLLGERAPHWNSHASGVFFGITIQHTQAHFTRAVIEGIGMALYDIAQAMNLREDGVNVIHVSGGFVHSKEWLQILADIFGCKLALMNTTDASALGAAYLAMKEAGVFSEKNLLKKRPVDEIIPDPGTHLIYQKHYEIFRELYNNLKGFMKN
ncbi:MAG TPA: gluconokinase [Chryseosolibacter sp.]|nr:gluconokinase [Chryseosolibacter sp.]